MDLERIIRTISDKFGVSEEHRELGLEFLTSRFDTLNHTNVYKSLNDSVLESELQLFYYLNGSIAINTDDGPKTIESRKDLYLLRLWEMGIADKKKRSDMELFRLYRKISQRHSKKGDPSWGELIGQLGRTKYISKHLRRTITYDDVLKPLHALTRYMAGEVSVRLKNGKKKRIRKPEELPFLSVMDMYRRKDIRLIRLYKRVKEEQINNGGPSWLELERSAGRRREVVANIGRIAVSGDVTNRYEFDEYVSLLSHHALNMPMQGEHGTPTTEDILNLHVFSDAYRNSATKRGSDNLLEKIFSRVDQRAWKGRNPTSHQVAEMVFQQRTLVQKYGRAFTSRELDMIAGLKQYADRLESMMMGENTLTIGGFEKTIDSVSDMRLLISFPKRYQVTDVQTIRTGISLYYSSIGIKYYDLFDFAGARPRVVERYERPVTRADANPKLVAA